MASIKKRAKRNSSRRTKHRLERNEFRRTIAVLRQSLNDIGVMCSKRQSVDVIADHCAEMSNLTMDVAMKHRCYEKEI